MKLTLFGPEVCMDEKTYVLTFGEGLVPKSSSSKYFSQIRHLAYDEAGAPEKELCYTFYQDLIRKEDAELFASRSFTNGITVLMPGQMGKECRKNSGHYHGYIEGHSRTFTEVYEVLIGEAIFLIQESHNFDREGELEVESLTAVKATPGDKVIIPPFCAHCVSNVGEGPMAFGNLAAVCPLFYEPIQKKKGFGVYILKEKDGTLSYMENRSYQRLPRLQLRQAKEAPELGITKNRSLYESFVREPERFEFLYEPEKYEAQVWEFIR